MVYRLRLTNPLDTGFVQEYLMPRESTFAKFCDLLHRELSLESGHLVSFNVKGPNGEHGMELTMMDIADEEPEYPMVSMEEMRLMDILTSVGSQVLFTYDMLQNLALDVELVDIEGGTCSKPHGECVLRVGKAPRVQHDAFVEQTQGHIDALLVELGVGADG